MSIKDFFFDRTVVVGDDLDDPNGMTTIHPSLVYVTIKTLIVLFFWLSLLEGADIVLNKIMPKEFASTLRILPEISRWYYTVCIAWAVYTVLQVICESMTISQREVLYQNGILSRKSEAIPITAVASVRIDRSLTQRLFGVGNVMIASPGTSAYEIQIANVANPLAVGEKIKSMTNRYGGDPK